MSTRSEMEADLKRCLENKPKLEAKISALTSELQQAQIALDKCNADIATLTEQLK